MTIMRTTITRMTTMAMDTTAVRRSKEMPYDDAAAHRAGDSVGHHRRHGPFKPLLFGGGFGESIYFNAEHHGALHEIGASVGDWLHFAAHAFSNPVFWIW